LEQRKRIVGNASGSATVFSVLPVCFASETIAAGLNLIDCIGIPDTWVEVHIDPVLDDSSRFKLIEGSCAPKRLPGEDEVELRHPFVQGIKSAKKSLEGSQIHLSLHFSVGNKAPNLPKNILLDPDELNFQVMDDIAQCSDLRELENRKSAAVHKVSESQKKIQSGQQELTIYESAYKSLVKKHSIFGKSFQPT